ELPPFARHRAGELPPAPAFLVGAGDEFAVGFPAVERRRPHRLRLRPNEAIGAVALQLASVPAVDEAVIVPGFGHEGGKTVDHHAPIAVPAGLSKAWIRRP